MSLTCPHWVSILQFALVACAVLVLCCSGGSIRAGRSGRVGPGGSARAVPVGRERGGANQVQSEHKHDNFVSARYIYLGGDNSAAFMHGRKKCFQRGGPQKRPVWCQTKMLCRRENMRVHCGALLIEIFGMRCNSAISVRNLSCSLSWVFSGTHSLNAYFCGQFKQLL